MAAQETVTIIPMVNDSSSSDEEVTIIKAPSSKEQFSYGLERGRTDIGYAIDYARSLSPFGSFTFGPDGFRYYSSEELYGEDFESLTPEERRNRINSARDEELRKNNLAVVLYGEQDSAEALSGDFLASLASPTTLIPIGGGAKAGYKAVALASGLLGAEYNVLEQLALTGKVEPSETVTVGGLSAVGGVAILGGARGISKGYSKLKNIISKKNKATPDEIIEASSKVDQINDATLEASEQGISKEDLSAFVRDKTGMSTDEIAESIAMSHEKPIALTKVDALNARILHNAGAGEDQVTKFVGLKEAALPQSDMLREISPYLSRKVRDYHLSWQDNWAKNVKPIDDLYKIDRKLSKEQREVFDNLLFNSNPANIAKARKILTDVDANAGKHFDMIFGPKGNIYKQRNRLVKDAKISLPDDPYYVTRVVKDYNGFRKYIGLENRNKLDKALNARAKFLNTKVNDLDQDERDFIANAIVRGLRPITNMEKMKAVPTTGGSKPSFLQGRKVGNVDRELQQFYKRPYEAVSDFLAKSERLIQKKNLFGDSTVIKSNQLNVKETIGNYLDIINKQTPINEVDFDIIQNILEAEFTSGERRMSKLAAGLKDWTNASLLANYATSVIQLADSGITAMTQGFRNTIGVLLGGGQRISSKELFGLDAVTAEYFTSGNKISQSVDRLMRLSGFKAFDSFGKDTLIRAAWKRVRNQVKTPNGIAKLKKEIGQEYPNEFDQLIDEIIKGDPSAPLAKSFLYGQLSNQHPTSTFEMPLKFSQMEDGRLIYTLKSFTIKQIALMRKLIANEYRKGNKKEAMRNAIAFMLLVPTTNMSIQAAKDLMLGRNVDLENELVDRYVDNVFRVFASSQYSVSKLKETGDITEFVIDSFAPPYNVFQNATTGAWNSIQNGEFDPKTFKDVPFLGKFYYNWFGGGLDKFNERKEKQRYKEIFGEE